MTTRTIDDERLAQFATDLRGDVIGPDDAAYDDARAVWNGLIDRRPAVIARCRGVADVRAALAFAWAHDLTATVRGGGHNVAGTAVCDGGLVVDLSRMDAVTVDPGGPTARVEGGATWADVDRETQAFGLAVPGGVVSDTGVGGLTLGGGIGHLRRTHGLSCDNLLSVDLVTAGGDVVTASADEHPDLFWGLRGGGGGLGVATAFEFECHPVGPDVATCLVFYSATELRSALRKLRSFAVDAPDEVSTLVFAGELPEEDLFRGTDLHRQKFAVMACYAGPVDEGKRALAPLRELAEPMADVSGTVPYVEFQQVLDGDYPDGLRYYWKSLFLADLSDGAIDRIVDWAEAAPSPLSTVDVWHLGGAIDRTDPAAGAFAGRGAPFLLGVEANWEAPATDDANVQWVRDCVADMCRFSDGTVYLNFPGFFEEGASGAFGPSYERLAALRDEYDPTGLFAGAQSSDGAADRESSA
ncbi:FAD-binding oxidoreductase [Halomicrobium urmianum]|uniref:FAD-binding oxidoreductase n=1 Tax=Halomicrobium urmianum TaxID=1586233 RepID=UPI001CD9E888|nr:FAD-binding oxidoreductase [Halomicrobium urmianum]